MHAQVVHLTPAQRLRHYSYTPAAVSLVIDADQTGQVAVQPGQSPGVVFSADAIEALADSVAVRNPRTGQWEERPSFQAWLAEVDRELISICFLSHDDLPDQPYMDWYREGQTARCAAECALNYAGYDVFGDPADWDAYA